MRLAWGFFFRIQILRRSGEDKTQRALRVVPGAGCARLGRRSASPRPNPHPGPRLCPLLQQIWGFSLPVPALSLAPSDLAQLQQGTGVPLFS